MQADGSVIAVGLTGTEQFTPSPGNISAARFTPAGGLDPSFGAGGVVVIGLPGQYDSANAVVVHGDGRT